MEDRSRPGPGVPLTGALRQGSAPGWGRPAPGAAAAARSGAPPVIVECFGNQHLERAIFSLEISNQSASFPSHYTPLTFPSSLQKEKEKSMYI